MIVGTALLSHIREALSHRFPETNPNQGAVRTVACHDAKPTLQLSSEIKDDSAPAMHKDKFRLIQTNLFRLMFSQKTDIIHLALNADNAFGYNEFPHRGYGIRRRLHASSYRQIRLHFIRATLTQYLLNPFLPCLF